MLSLVADLSPAQKLKFSKTPLRGTHFTLSFQILVELVFFITNIAHTMQSARLSVESGLTVNVGTHL